MTERDVRGLSRGRDVIKRKRREKEIKRSRVWDLSRGIDAIKRKRCEKEIMRKRRGKET